MRMNNGRFLCRAEVMQKTGLASVMITRFMDDGDFPKPCNPHDEVDLWRDSEVQAWMDSRSQAARVAGHGC